MPPSLPFAGRVQALPISGRVPARAEAQAGPRSERRKQASAVRWSPSGPKPLGSPTRNEASLVSRRRIGARNRALHQRFTGTGSDDPLRVGRSSRSCPVLRFGRDRSKLRSAPAEPRRGRSASDWSELLSFARRIPEASPAILRSAPTGSEFLSCATEKSKSQSPWILRLAANWSKLPSSARKSHRAEALRAFRFGTDRERTPVRYLEEPRGRNL